MHMISVHRHIPGTLPSLMRRDLVDRKALLLQATAERGKNPHNRHQPSNTLKEDIAY